MNKLEQHGDSIHLAAIDRKEAETLDASWIQVDCTRLKATWRQTSLKRMSATAHPVLDWIRSSPSFEVLWARIKDYLGQGPIKLALVSTGKYPMRAHSMQHLCKTYLEETGIDYTLKEAVRTPSGPTTPYVSWQEREKERARSNYWRDMIQASTMFMNMGEQMLHNTLDMHRQHAEARLRNAGRRAQQRAAGEEMEEELPDLFPLSILSERIQDTVNMTVKHVQTNVANSARLEELLDAQ